MDLLVHHGATKTVQVISQESRKTRERWNAFFALYGRIGKRAFLENVELRLTNLDGTLCLQDNSIITQRYTSFGSYTLSSVARVCHWESLTIVDTKPPHVERFEELWTALSGRPIERVYPEMDDPTKGPKRQKRQTG